MRKFQKFQTMVAGCAFFTGLCLAGAAQAGSFKVMPSEFDPGKTQLVSAKWVRGVGCPPPGTSAVIYPDTTPTPYSDPACDTADPKDKSVEGLLLVKTGPTLNNAAAVASIKGLKKGTHLTELGYDIRKVAQDDRGSHCGAGAPRFNVVIDGVLYYLGCNSPAPTSTVEGTGWLRLLWGPCGTTPLLAWNAITWTLDDLCGGEVDSISIVFDEGQDSYGGPDQFGAVILDNINVNGLLVGHGPEGDK